MPIIDIQRRLREAGRIRLGEKRRSAKSGKEYPAKLATFRLTSGDRTLLEQAAKRYGGNVEPWPEQDGQFQVTTSATEMDVIVPPTEMAFSQWYEQWSGGGCKRRCDGRWEILADIACPCDPSDRDCAPHTRLSVMLRELPGVGTWRLDTQGWNAAVELLGTVELIQQAAARGQMLPARLLLVRRTSKHIDRDTGEASTRKYVVPALDIDVNLLQPGAAAAAAIDLGVPALEPAEPEPTFDPVPAIESGPAPTIAEQAAAEPKAKAKRGNAAEPLKSTGKRPRKAAEVEQPAIEAPTPAVVDTPDISAEDPTGPSADAGASEDLDPSGPEEAPAAPPAEPAAATAEPEADQDSVARAQTVARWISDAGITSDEERHRFLVAYSHGAWSSSYDVPVAGLAGLRSATVQIKKGLFEIRQAEGEEPRLIGVKSGAVLEFNPPE